MRQRPVDRRPDLLAFLLFDDRESHRIVQEFAHEEFTWLDGLATTARMILFFFLPENPRTPEGPGLEELSTGDTEEGTTDVPSQVVVAGSEGEVKNPSLEVAASFGLTAKDLPGVVFFTELDLDLPGPHSGVFCPLSIDLFSNRREAEDRLASLFDLVHRAKGSSSARMSRRLFAGERLLPPDLQLEAFSAEELLERLRSLIEAEKRKAMTAPFLAALRTGVISLIKFPGKLAEVTAMAFGQELGKRTAQGAP